MRFFLILNVFFDLLASSDGCLGEWPFRSIIDGFIVIFLNGMNEVKAFGVTSCT